jgi:hypothetical protein
MTDFEKKIKRGITHEKFVEIRDTMYGDDKDIIKYKFGNVSSFLTWNRDESGKIKELDEDDETDGQYDINDGQIYDWDREKLSRSKITTDIIFIAENMSRDGKPLSKNFIFQNARRHKFIVDTFKDTEAEGAYFTDILKPDNRIIDEIKNAAGKAADGGNVWQIVKSRPDILQDHFDLFNKELELIGAEKPLLIVFGTAAKKILELGFKENILKKNNFYDDIFVEIYHYTFTWIAGGFEAYKNDTREKLSEYITIP